MSEKKVDVADRYSHELNEIRNKLNQLDKGRVYDISGVQSDGYLSTNIDQLRKMLSRLIYNIEYDGESFHEKLGAYFEKVGDE